MGRIRTLKPEFPINESIGRLSVGARFLLLQLEPYADDAGRTRGSIRVLTGALYPYDDDAPALLGSWLDELEREHYIVRYCADGQHYLQILGWLDDQSPIGQKIDHPGKSRIPAPSQISENSREPSRESREMSLDLATDLVPSTLDLVSSNLDQKPWTKDQKPFRARRGTVKFKAKIADSRHVTFKAAIGTYWSSKNSNIEMPWDGQEGRALNLVLKAMPDLAIEQFENCLNNRAKSQVNHGERPSRWLQAITSYIAGPIDRFNRPINQEVSGGKTVSQNRTTERVDGNRRAIADAIAARGIRGPWCSYGEDGTKIPQPGSQQDSA